MTSPQKFRALQLATLTNATGVYALCDLDGQPIYVGQSVDGIRARVQRHLTSARSDMIANRMLDVWEIAYVDAWPLDDPSKITSLEAFLFNVFDSQKQLMNGKAMPSVGPLPFAIPERQRVQIIDEELRYERSDPSQRLPRQIAQYLALVDYIQVVKDERHLKRSLQAHFERMVDYHRRFLA